MGSDSGAYTRALLGDLEVGRWCQPPASQLCQTLDPWWTKVCRDAGDLRQGAVYITSFIRAEEAQGRRPSEAKRGWEGERGGAARRRSRSARLHTPSLSLSPPYFVMTRFSKGLAIFPCFTRSPTILPPLAFQLLAFQANPLPLAPCQAEPRPDTCSCILTC